MRKITQIFACLLMCLSAVCVHAQNLQDQYGMTPVITSDAMFSSPFSDEVEGLSFADLVDNNAETFWHTDWHNRVEGNYHYIDVNFAEPISGNFILYMLRRNTDQDHPTVIALDGSNDGERWNNVDTLKLAFNGKAKEELSQVWTVKEPVSHLRFTVTDCAPSFRKIWHAAEIQIFSASEGGLANYYFDQVLLKYDEYLPGYGGSFDLGTNPGQYSDVAAWEAFQKDLIYVKEYIDGLIQEVLTMEQAQAIVARIEANYQAILDSKVPLAPIASGYYYIGAAMQYTHTTEVPQVDENGDPVIDPNTGEQVIITESRNPQMAIYTSVDNLNWAELDENVCTYLFRLDYNPETNNYKFYNCANEGRLAPVSQSAAVMTDKTLDPLASEVAINLERKDENGREIVSISRADQNSGFAFLHQGGHNGGAGTGSNVVGWEKCPASEWFLIPVEEAKAQALIEAWAPIRDREAMLRQVNEMVVQSKLALRMARDIRVTNIDKGTLLVTNPTQFSSPFTTADGKEIPLEEVYTYLLDGDPATYWHSRWEDGVRPGGTHYLQVELTDPAAVSNAAIEFTRRATPNDHITEWGVYGTNVADAEKAACEELDILSTPFTSSSETLASVAFPTKGYKYLRFYINNTAGLEQSSTNGFGHMAEFQLYPAQNEENPNSQMAKLGQLYTDLQAAVAAVPAVQDEITVDHFNKLKKVYDAFMAKYVDPSALRAAIASARAAVRNLAVGDEPGFWSAGAIAEIEQVINTAAAYDETGVYTKEESDKFVNSLETEANNFFLKANKVLPNKWYYLHLASEEMYDQNHWNKDGLNDTNSGMGLLYGQYVTVGHVEAPEGDNNDMVVPHFAEEIREGNGMYFTELLNDDNNKFRFIAVGDTAYVMQNKATGLYINCGAANSNNVTLSLVPTTFKVEAVGHGQMGFKAVSLTGEGLTNLHVQKSNHRLVTWDAFGAGTNSAFFVQTAEDVDVSALTNMFYRSVRPGKVYPLCYPVPVSAGDGMYTVAGTYSQGEKNYVGLSLITSAKAGQPFIYINGLPENYQEPAQGEEPAMVDVEFTVGNEVVSAPDNTGANGLEGTFVTKYVDKGTTVFVKNGAEGADGAEGTDCTRKVWANSAYLNFGTTTIEPGVADIEIEVMGRITIVSIQEALDNVSKAGNVYDMNGRLVRTGATLKDVKALGRGMYILNGVKVLVN